MTRCIRRSSRRSGRAFLASTHFAGRTRARNVAAIGRRSPRLIRLRLGRPLRLGARFLGRRIWRLGFGRSLGPGGACRLLVLLETALLVLFPDPQWQGSLRPGRSMLLAIMVGSVPYRLWMASRLVRLRGKRDHNGETEKAELGVSESTDDVVLARRPWAGFQRETSCSTSSWWCGGRVGRGGEVNGFNTKARSTGDDTKDGLGRQSPRRSEEREASPRSCIGHDGHDDTTSTMIVARLERWSGLLARRPAAGLG